MLGRTATSLSILTLITVAVLAGTRSSVPRVTAQTTIDQLESNARADFSQQVANHALNTGESSVSIQSVNGVSDLPFPHMALYGGPNSSGWPMVGVLSNTRPDPGTPLNEDVMNAYARFPHVILPATPLSDSRPDILTSLRERNSAIRVHAYVMGSTTWCPSVNGNIAYPPGVYYRDYYLAVTDGDPSCASTSDRFLWMQDGLKADVPPHNMGINVNLAHRVQNPDNSYTYDVAEAIAETMYEYGRAGRNWDGIFIDVYCPGILWMETPGHLFDYARAGYNETTPTYPIANENPANRTAFDTAWQEGHQRMASRLRELAIADGHADYPISGNCGQAPARLHSEMNGWMRENFPYQNGGNFYTNMLTWPWGSLHQDNNFRAPQYNYIFTAANWSGGLTNNPGDEQYNSTNQRKMRFGLGSAALGNGWAAFHHSSGNPAEGYWFNWWYDEYGVNTAVPQSNVNWGKAMNGATYTGWLGQALTPAYQILATTYESTPDLLTANQGFETAGATPSQLPSWTTPAFAPTTATYERTTTTAGAESASAHVTVSAIHDPAIYWSTYMASGNFQVSAGTSYGVSFKAKTSSVLPVTLSIGNAIQTLSIDGEWRQYQAVLTPSNTVSNGTVGIHFGLATGEYWIDDVHVQAAPTSVWRRDFTRGIVLVNPTAISQTILLEKPYRKILGNANPTLNDGSQVSTVTIPGTNSLGGTGDALFLLNLDLAAPNSVTDLRAP